MAEANKAEAPDSPEQTENDPIVPDTDEIENLVVQDIKPVSVASNRETTEYEQDSIEDHSISGTEDDNENRTARIEYKNILETLTLQTENVNLLKRALFKANDSNTQKEIINLYTKEYEKTDGLALDAIKVQRKNPYIKWSELPMPIGIHDDILITSPGMIMNQVRLNLCADGNLLRRYQDEDSKRDGGDCVKLHDNSKCINQYETTNDECSSVKPSISDNECEQNQTELINQLQKKIEFLVTELCKYKQEQLPQKSSTDGENETELDEKIAAIYARLKKFKKCPPEIRQTKKFKKKFKKLEKELVRLCQEKERFYAGNDKKIEKSPDNAAKHQHEIRKSKAETIGGELELQKLNLPEMPSLCSGDKKLDENKPETFDSTYIELLIQYNKVMRELKDIKTKFNITDLEGDEDNFKIRQIEAQAFKDQVKGLLEEQEAFKCLLKEQSNQLEEYRHKYLKAQQTIQEQECAIKNLEMSNSRVEDQINLEIHKLKCKFQNKLKDLAVYPKLLEDEQIKLAQCCKENEELTKKLCIICREYKYLKAQKSEEENAACVTTNNLHSDASFERLVIERDEAYKARDILCSELERARKDLTSSHTEAATILTRNKMLADCEKEFLKKSINKLEEELVALRAQSRSLLIKRDEYIRELEAKVEALSSQHEVSESEIASLKNHIKFLSYQLHSQAERFAHK